MEHFVIVGAGIAGLSAANALADTGAKVTVLEQSNEPGGRARTHQEKGYALNLGPHALYRAGIAARTFSQWKIPFSGGDPGEKAAAIRPVLVRGRQCYPAVKDVGTLLTSSLFSACEKLEVARLLRLFMRGTASPSETVAQWLDREIRSQRVRDYAAAVIRIASYCGDFDHLSAGAALRQVSMVLKEGVLYIDGGWQTLVTGLIDRARSLGVEILCGERVTSLDHMQADGIVLAVDPETVEKITQVQLPARIPAYAACLDLCLNTWPEGAPTAGFALDRPLYYAAHSVVAQVAPEGGATVHIGKYLQRPEQDHAALRRELEDYADLLLPQWRTHLNFARFLPNLRVTAAIPGTTERPGEQLPGLERIAIAGDWVGSEGMLTDAAVASALKATMIVTEANPVAA